MVLFDEDPVTLIRETTSQFHIAPDRDSLSRISDSLSSLSQARQTRLAHQHGQLKSLSRRLNGLEEGHRWEEDRHDAGVHAERMLKMDAEKFRVAKGVSDAEIEVERLEGERVGLRTQLDLLEREGVEGGGRRGRRGGGGGGGVNDSEDEIVLKLHLYRSLNISATQDPSTGAFNRAVVRRVPGASLSASTAVAGDDAGSGTERKAAGGGGDVSIIHVDGNLDQSFYTNMFWEAL